MNEIQLLLQQLVDKVVRNEEKSRPKIEDLCKLKIRHVTTETIYQNEDPSEIAVSESFDDALKIIGQFCINAGVKRCSPYRKGIIVKVGKINHREIIHWYRRSERYIFQNKTKTCSDDTHLEGIPFISFGGNIYSCQFNETNEMTGELKLGESVVLRKIATFPTFKVKSNTESEMNDKEALLREQLKNNSKSVDRKLAYLISFPRDIRRKSLHIDGDVSSLITLLKLKSAVLFPSILTKVEDLILQDLSYHQIDQYIRNEMFDQKTPPAKTDQRYYPDFSRLTDIRRVMLSANTLKMEDIDHLDKSFQELKEKKNAEIYFKVYQHQPPSPNLNGYKRPQNDSSFNQENSVDLSVNIPPLPGTSRCNKSTVPNSVCAENEGKKRRKKPNPKYQIPAYPNYQLQANRKYQRESRKRTKINTLLLQSDRIPLLKNAPYKHKRPPLKPPIWDSPIQRFLLFHQSQSQQYLLNRYGSFVYITEVQPKSIGYKAANGVATFLIYVRTNVDCQVVGTILCNKYNDHAQVLKEALTEFKEINEFWRPKYLMIDPSDAMVNSVGEVFPGVDYYFNSNSCIQEWEKKLKDSPSDVTEQFETIIEMMKDLQTSPLEEIGILLTRTVRMVKSVNFPRYHFWISQRKKWASCYFPMDLSFFLRDDWLCKTTEKYELQLRNYSRKNSSGLVRLMENIITQMADSQYKRYVLINQELNDSGLKIVKENPSLNDQYGLPLHMMTHCAPIVKRLNSGHSSKKRLVLLIRE
uniref:Uncharacterized protein n=1 Tax=Clytia hemisphaerica TaxID=252671 RepID=A0A7M5X5H9_9CNID